jgi:hypothetical protein
LNTALDDTPKLAAANFHCVSSGQPACLEVPAELMEDGFLKVSENTNSGEKVVQV